MLTLPQNGRNCISLDLKFKNFLGEYAPRTLTGAQPSAAPFRTPSPKILGLVVQNTV